MPREYETKTVKLKRVKLKRQILSHWPLASSFTRLTFRYVGYLQLIARDLSVRN